MKASFLAPLLILVPCMVFARDNHNLPPDFPWNAASSSFITATADMSFPDVRLNFDDITAPLVFEEALPLRDAYAQWGVNFTGVSNLDGGAVLDAVSFNVHGYSRPNALCFNNEGGPLVNGGMPAAPGSVIFSWPVVSVGGLIGSYNYRGQAVSIRAYNEMGDLVAELQIILSDTAEVFFLEAQDIVKVTFGGPDDAHSFLVDDLSFNLAARPAVGLTASIEPDAVIPFDGGAFRCRVVLTLPDPASITPFVDVLLPGGRTGHILSPPELEFGPGPHERSFVQSVPDSAPAGLYQYRVRAILSDGYVASATVPFEKESNSVAGVGLEHFPTPAIPTFVVPNPFNPVTRISFDLPQSGSVKVSIFDVAGHLVRILNAGVQHPAGRGSVTWNGQDNAGRTMPSGAYFFYLESRGYVGHGRMVLLK